MANLFTQVLSNLFGKSGGVKPSRNVQVLERVLGNQPADMTKNQQLAFWLTSPAFYAASLRVADSCASAKRWVELDGDPVDEHPLLDLLDRPNQYMSGYIYRLINQLYKDIIGESFDLPVLGREFGENTISLVPLLPTSISLVEEKWRVTNGNVEEIFELDELFWQKGLPNLQQPLGRGVGFGTVLQDEVQSDEAAARYETAFFKNGAKPEFVITLLGANDARAKVFSDRWDKRFRGAEKGFRPVIFNAESKDAQLPEITELSQRFKDIGVSEFRRFEQDIIRQTFAVPPEILGVVDNANRATITAAELIMEKYVVKPRLRMWEDDWNQYIVPLFDSSGRLKVRAEASIPKDKEHVREIMKNHPYAFTINETREEAGFPARKGGDVYWRPMAGSPMGGEGAEGGQMGGGGSSEVPAGEIDAEGQMRQPADNVIYLKGVSGN